MLKLFLFCSVVTLFLTIDASAQKVNTDSLKLIAKISKDQLELGKLINTVEQKTKKKEDGAMAAQKSADDNATAANKLSNDPQNKKDARLADNSAGDARSNARKARKAADELDKVNKNIADLQGKIFKEQAEMKRYTGSTSNLSLTPNAPMRQDSTQHP
jgi:hypothetical protein